jgi:hypothetical protein
MAELVARAFRQEGKQQGGGLAGVDECGTTIVTDGAISPRSDQEITAAISVEIANTGHAVAKVVPCCGSIQNMEGLLSSGINWQYDQSSHESQGWEKPSDDHL